MIVPYFFIINRTAIFVVMQCSSAIVLRVIPYGETSIIATLFTETWGVQGYIVKGVRQTKTKKPITALLQPGMLVEVMANHYPNKDLQYMQDLQWSYVYTTVQADVVKNSLALFAVEILLKLLPAASPMPELLQFSRQYLIDTDKLPSASLSNFGLYFMVAMGRLSGYTPYGSYNPETPCLNTAVGGFASTIYQPDPFTTEQDAQLLMNFLAEESYTAQWQQPIGKEARRRLMAWYMAYLQYHSGYKGKLHSLPILQALFD